METAVQLSFDKHCDRKQPKYWPVIPLKFWVLGTGTLGNASQFLASPSSSLLDIFQRKRPVYQHGGYSLSTGERYTVANTRNGHWQSDNLCIVLALGFLFNSPVHWNYCLAILPIVLHF
jgi:hypothetical protein